MKYSLTKDEALQILENGGKITHRSFSSKEWMKKDNTKSNTYLFEDGVRCHSLVFWETRPDKLGWDKGWAEIQKPANWIRDLSGSFDASEKYKLSLINKHSNNNKRF